MAKLVFAMNVSLDGYIDHAEIGPPVPAVFRHFVDQVRGAAGFLYGRRIYEVMRYWDEDQSNWGPEERDFATAWRSRRKWVVSHSVESVGSNAVVIRGDLKTEIRALKTQHAGEIQVGGPELAQGLSSLGLIDEYQMYFRPVVLGGGKPFFARSRPELKLAAGERIENVMRMTYVPA